MRRMKDSGVPWIGEIPEGWEVRRIGICYAERNEKVSDKDYPPLSVTKFGVFPQLESAAKTDNGDNRKQVCIGDFVINSRSDRRGSCGISSFDGSVSLINIVLFPKYGINNNYFSFVFKSNTFSDEFYKWGNGIVDDLWSTKWQNMKKIFVPFPPLPEQHRIAAYLDAKCAEIDRSMELARQGIDKLKAYRMSVITEAVTKGLDPDVPMKDSGVPWIGETPSMWIFEKLKNFFTFEKGINAQKYTKEFIGTHQGDFPVYSGQTENDGIMGSIDSFDYDIQNCIFTTTVGAKVMSAKVISGKFSLSQNCLIMKPINNSVIVEYFLYILIALFEYEKSLIPTYMQPSLRISDLLKYSFFIPQNFIEQKQIAAYLDAKCAEIDAIIAQKQELLDKLAAYRKSLIFECVTGKREVAA